MPLPLLAIIPSIFSWYQKKQEMQMRLYEIAWDALKEITTFILRNWRVILKWLMVLAILAYVLALYAHSKRLASEIITLKADKAQIQLNFNNYVESIAKLAAEREAEIKVKSDIAKKELAAIDQTHKKIISQILLKGKKNETLSNSMLVAGRDGLRLAIERESSRRKSENDADRLAERDGNTNLLGRVSESDAELALCKEAVAIAASDYNYCKAYVDSQMKKIGVENE